MTILYTLFWTFISVFISAISSAVSHITRHHNRQKRNILHRIINHAKKRSDFNFVAFNKLEKLSAITGIPMMLKPHYMHDMIFTVLRVLQNAVSIVCSFAVFTSSPLLLIRIVLAIYIASLLSKHAFCIFIFNCADGISLYDMHHNQKPSHLIILRLFVHKTKKLFTSCIYFS